MGFFDIFSLVITLLNLCSISEELFRAYEVMPFCVAFQLGL